jgi:hypothetical protein
MKYVAAKYLTLIGMMFIVAWFFWNPEGWTFEWEPIVTFTLTLAGFIVADRHINKTEETCSVSDHDINLYEKLVASLPVNGVMRVINEHDFLDSFERCDISDLRRFTCEWDNSEHEFVDSSLEALRTSFLKAAGAFNLAVAKYTSPNNLGFQSVRVDSQLHDPVHEARFHKEATIINNAASKAYDAHQSLIRACKTRLSK